MAASTGQDFDIYAGNTATITFTVVDGDGAAKDIGGATILWRAARDGIRKRVVLRKTGSVSGDGSGGVFTVALAATDTANLKAGKYYHEAKVTDASSNVATVTTGTMTVKDTIC